MAVERVKKMCGLLGHRGPDDEGIVAGRNWALGHRRLSIIDLSEQARQPFANETSTCFLAANGEIYNFADLRQSLLQCGHVFVSKSDCEVALHLLEDGWADSIPRLKGMFAFAFVDERRRVLLLGRDRLGIKPLYYRCRKGAIVFASEIKALFGEGQRPELASHLLREYFQYRYIAGQDTLFDGVQQVLPGHVLEINLDSLRICDRTYWSASKRQDENGVIDEGEVRSQLEASVRSHLVSDVPVGCQLSGGLDSSLITAMAMKATRHSMHSFSVGFAGYEHDESRWALQVSRELGTQHHPIPYTERDFLEDFAIGTYLNDEPLNHANSLPMYKLCREARKHVTVLLTGEGADELFAGYSWHRRLWRLNRLGKVVQWPLVGDFFRLFGLRRLQSILPLLGHTPRDMASQAGKWMPDGDIDTWLQVDNGDSSGFFRRTLEVNERDPLAAVLDMDLHTYLVSVLQRQDRMSMASGVESRVPFLDHDFVQLALSIPTRQLFSGGRGKAVLRHISRDFVPNVILDRPKVGFCVPLAQWMRQKPGMGSLLTWLEDERSLSRGLWHSDRVHVMIVEHLAGHRDHSNFLWTLLAFEVWARIWLDDIPHQKVRESVIVTAMGGARLGMALVGKH
jgi:asparagine synthase (glutamine-hydrolysing)